MKKLLLLLTIILLLFSCSEKNIVDSDGDGMSDSKELEYFNPEVDPYTYNPNISDLPILDIDIYDVPQLSVNYITTSSQSQSQSYSSSTIRDRESESSVSAGGSASMTVSTTVEAKASWVDPTVSASGTVSGTVEINSEMSKSIRNSITKSWDRERSTESGETITAEEAKISVPVFIKNVGNTPVAVRDLILTAYSVNIFNQMEMIGSLTAENFKDIYLQPDSSPVIINYQNDDLYPSKIQDIMYNSRRIVVVPASYSMDIISNDEVLDYYVAHNQVKRKTSRVHFDDGIYDVAATNLKDILDVLRIDYVIKDEWITSINGNRGHNLLNGGEWQVSHFGNRNYERFEHIYNSYNPNLNVDIRPGDTVHIYKAWLEPPQIENNISLSHPSISSFEKFGDVKNHITNIDVDVKLERNSERGVYQTIDLDIEPQKRLVITTPNNILFEFSLDADVSDPNSPGSAYREADPNAEEKEHSESYFRSPKRVFINGEEVDFTFEHSGAAYDSGTLILESTEEIKTLDFYFYGGANPDILPYTPQAAEEGARTSWYDLTHIETYNFEG